MDALLADDEIVLLGWPVYGVHVRDLVVEHSGQTVDLSRLARKGDAFGRYVHAVQPGKAVERRPTACVDAVPTAQIQSHKIVTAREVAVQHGGRPVRRRIPGDKRRPP